MTTPKEFTYDVFLSHSSKDKAVVRSLAERLRKDGLHVWLDEWILKPGDNILAKIEGGLERSRVLILCLSANALRSDWVQLEAGMCRYRDPLNTEGRWIPVRFDDAPIPATLGQFLSVNLQPNYQEAEYAKLLKACRSNGKQDSTGTLDVSLPEIKAEARLASPNDFGHHSEDSVDGDSAMVDTASKQRAKATLTLYRALCGTEEAWNGIAPAFVQKPVDATLTSDFHKSLRRLFTVFQRSQKHLDGETGSALTAFFDSLVAARCNIRSAKRAKEWIAGVVRCYYSFPANPEFSFQFEVAFKSLHRSLDKSLFRAGAFGWACESPQSGGIDAGVPQSGDGPRQRVLATALFKHHYAKALKRLMSSNAPLSTDELMEMARMGTPFEVSGSNAARLGVRELFALMKRIEQKLSPAQRKALQHHLARLIRQHHRAATGGTLRTPSPVQ